MIQSLSFCAPRTVVKSPSDHSCAVPPATVTSLTSIVCIVEAGTLSHPSAGQPLSGHESHFQAVLVSVLCPDGCSLHLQRWSAVPIPGDLLQQSLPPVLSSHPLSQSFQTASKQGPSVPMGALSQESDTATSYCSSALNTYLSPGQILEACPDPTKWK